MSGQQLHPLSNIESSGSLKPDSSGSSNAAFPNISPAAGDVSPGSNRQSGVESQMHSTPRTVGSEHVNKRGPMKQQPQGSLHPPPQRGARPTSEILKPSNYANPESKENLGNKLGFFIVCGQY
jgi:hypothetical protein